MTEVVMYNQISIFPFLISLHTVYDQYPNQSHLSTQSFYYLIMPKSLIFQALFAFLYKKDLYKNYELFYF